MSSNTITNRSLGGQKSWQTRIANGITLSIKAHNEFHHTYGVKNNTREQLLEFLNKSK